VLYATRRWIGGGSGGQARREVGRNPLRLRHPQGGLWQVTEADIIEHCREHLAGFKVPKTVVFTELPKTSTGKIQKFVLREEARKQ
jgi:fatty-acyl-CoA synthase